MIISLLINFFFKIMKRGIIANPRVVMKYSGIVEKNKFSGKNNTLSIPKKVPVEPSPSIKELYS